MRHPNNHFQRLDRCIIHWSDEEVVRFAASFLERNLRDYESGHTSPKTRQEIAEWVFRDDPENPVGFLRICELIGVDPDTIRNHLRSIEKEAS